MSNKLSYIINFLLPFVFTICIYPATFAQKTDSTKFDLQRERVNKMIEARSNRFGDFDKSIKQKTGVFGIFKTKKDMQNSIEILKSIVIADNNILLETKKLIDIKDNEQLFLNQQNQQFESQITGYINTISKLQEENEKLKEQWKNQQNLISKNTLFICIIFILVGLLITPFCIRAYRGYKSHK